jgi:streptomycin 6-kinase
VDEQLAILCATLREAWTTPPDGERFVTGAEKAASLARFIETAWLERGRPCFERTVERALAYAESRRRSFDARDAVLAHGDAHG